MKILIRQWLALLICLPLGAVGSGQAIVFDELLAEAGLTYTQPADYSQIAIQHSDLLPYERAIRSDDAQLEVRYAIRPLARMNINYQDPHSSAPEPNHIFTMMFTALIGHMSKGGNSPHREYPQEQARGEFNADWAALSLFDLEPDYSRQYSQAFLLAMHKNNLADAYIVILFNDHNVVRNRLDLIMQSLAFK